MKSESLRHLIRAIAIAGLVWLVVSFGVTPVVHSAGVWYVAPTGNDSNDCASSATACASINGALNKPSFVQGDSIRVAVGTYTGSGTEVVSLDKNVTLAGGWNSAFTGQTGVSTIDGQGARRGITLNFGVTASIERIVVQNGFSIWKGGGILINAGTLTISNSSILNNTASETGGGISNFSGTLTVVNTTISGNAGNYGGGGIDNYGLATVTNTTISGNIVGTPYSIRTPGSGILNTGAGTSLTLDKSTVSGNLTRGYLNMYGSAINNLTALTMTNSTVSGNDGDGIYTDAPVSKQVTLDSNTIVSNQGLGLDAAADLSLRNNVIASNNSPYGDCHSLGYLHNLGFNLVYKNVDCPLGSSDLVNVNPNLGPLQNNGGPTLTHALLAGSPAINAGSVDCPPPATDQRGMPRIGRCDIGAFEFQQPDKTPPAITITSPQAREYLHTATFQVLWTAVDTESGIASESATLDGNAVSKGQTVDLFYLALGPHTVTVTAKDKAGNTGSASITFTVVANIDSLIAAKDRACALGWISSADVCSGLGDKLVAAKGALERGQNSAAKNQLNAFLNQLEAQKGKAVNLQAYNLLKTDAQYVIDHLP